MDLIENRYKVSFKQSTVYGLGAFVDTMEISAPYERLTNIYNRVVDELDSNVLIMAHFSHAYRDGGSIYFTFVGERKDADQAEQLYLEVWRRALDTVVAHGGSISHHHGVGMLKAKWMGPTLGAQMGMAQALKDKLDPDGLMNPGKLGLV